MNKDSQNLQRLAKAQRILIIGNAGSGKSTLARELGELFNLPVIHLDSLFWQPGWAKPSDEAWYKTLSPLVNQRQWIMDGQFAFLEERVQAADTIIFLNFSRWPCLWRAFKRRFQHHGKDRSDRAKGCKERLSFDLISYIWTFRKKRYPRIFSLLTQYKKGRRIIVLESSREVAEFLNQWKALNKKKISLK